MSHPDGDLFLLEATWQDDTGEYRKRCIFTHAVSVEAMFEMLAKERSEWRTTKDYRDVGQVDGHYTSVTVFKVEWSDDRSWPKWVDERRNERREQIKVEDRERDLEEIRRLVAKHGVDALEVLAMAAEE